MGHLRAGNAKRGTDYDPYAVCTTSIGYSGSYTGEHRGGARTPGGRAKKVASGRVKVQHEPRKKGVHWKPETERVYRQDLAKGKK